MRRNLLLFLLLLMMAPLGAASNEMFPIGDLGIGFTGLPDEFLYPSYLADPIGTKTLISLRNYAIDEVHPREDGTSTHYDVTVGTRYNFLRLSPEDHPELGIEMDWGMALTSFMDTDANDFLGVDGIYYFALAIRPSMLAAFRVSRHHICSHNGDQVDIDEDGSAFADFDLASQLNDGTFVRDDYIISAAIEPIYLFSDGYPVTGQAFRLYGDFSFYLPGAEPAILGWRKNRPSDHAYIWYQYGAELILPILKEDLGSIVLAGQVSQWQETGYAPNYSLQAGYMFARGKSAQTMRFVATYYDGQSLMNNYRYTRAKFMGVSFIIDT